MPLRAFRWTWCNTRKGRGRLNYNAGSVCSDLLGHGEVGCTDTQAMAKAAVNIKGVGRQPALITFGGRTGRFMLMFVVSKMLRLSRSTFMHAIARHHSPAKLDR